ncbi:MAG: cytochrome c oxidase assembly protein [Novosphingobium sp.]|nr:cytochrome c oxidase assembly protein [Novosphingobium sp.]
MFRLTAAALAPVAFSTPAGAHEAHGEAIGWTLDPQVTLPLLVTLALYVGGLFRLRRRAHHGGGLLTQRAPLFLGGWAILAGALVSPLHEAGEVSFTMHMIEHELIMLPAALLLVAARPGPVLLWGLPAAGRQLFAPIIRLPLWRGLAAPVIATAIQAAVLVLWHMPALFDRALRHDGWHIVQHLCFVASALLFWTAMLPRCFSRAGAMTAALCLFVTSMIGGGLGALMSLAGSPWYAVYAAMGMTPFGLTPSEDQQLAGLIMWIPGGLFHLGAALILLARALQSTVREDHRESRGRETA